MYYIQPIRFVDLVIYEVCDSNQCREQNDQNAQQNIGLYRIIT